MIKWIRVALSGSGFRLSAHLGALQAILDAGFTIKEIAGTSGGSIVAALFACGMSLDDMRELCMTMDWSPMMHFSPLALFNQGLCTGDALTTFLYEKTRAKSFAELAVDLKIIASDLATEREYLFSRETTPDAHVGLAARASASIPIVFAPVLYKDAVLVDGGCTDNVPVSDLVVDEIPRIGIYLKSDDQPLLGGKHDLVDLAPRIIDLMLASNEAAHIALDEKGGAYVVAVEAGYASSFDRNMPIDIRQKLYDDGYAATLNALTNAASREVQLA